MHAQVLQPVLPPPALVLPLHLCTQGDTDIVPGSKSATSPDVTIFTANAAAFRVTVVEGSLSAPTNHITTTNVSAPRRGHIDAVFAAAAERASENIQPNISSLVARQKQCVSSSTPRQNKYFTPAYNATKVRALQPKCFPCNAFRSLSFCRSDQHQAESDDFREGVRRTKGSRLVEVHGHFAGQRSRCSNASHTSIL